MSISIMLSLISIFIGLTKRVYEAKIVGSYISIVQDC